MEETTRRLLPEVDLEAQNGGRSSLARSLGKAGEAGGGGWLSGALWLTHGQNACDEVTGTDRGKDSLRKESSLGTEQPGLLCRH